MGYPDDEGVMTFLRNGDQNSMAITFFGTLNSLNTIQRIPSRIPISVNSHRERERKAANHHLRDRERSPLRQEQDVRYLNSLKLWKNRVKQACSQQPPCNQNICPQLEGRYEKHLLDKHTRSIKKQATQCGESCIYAIKKITAATSTTSVGLTKTIFSSPVLPALDRNKSYVINKKKWFQHQPGDRQNYRIYNEDNDIINEGTNTDDDPNLNHDGLDDNPTNLKSDHDSYQISNNRTNGTDHDTNEYDSMVDNASGYNTNHNSNKDYKINSYKKDQNTMYSDAVSSNIRRNIKYDSTNHMNNANLNEGSISNRHRRNVAHDNNEHSTVTNDVNFRNDGYYSNRNYINYNNSGKHSSAPNNHNNVADDNIVEPKTSFSKRHNPESNDDRNRKQLNDNNMKYNAKYSDPEDKKAVSNKTTNISKGNDSNPNLAVGNNSVVDNNWVQNDAGSSKDSHNSKSNRANVDDGHTYKFNKSLNQDALKLKKNADFFNNVNHDDNSIRRDNQHKANLMPDAYSFISEEVNYRSTDTVYDAVNDINRLPNTIDNDDCNNNGNCSRPFFANSWNNDMEWPRRPLRSTSKSSGNNSIPLKRTDTREIVTPNRYIYKDCVQTEIRQWLEDVPLYLNHSEQERKKDDIVKTLTTKIINLGDGFKNSDHYERKFKFTVEQMLNSLPMWYPGQKSDQISFKNNLTNNLFNKIKAFSQNTKNKYLTTYRDSYTDTTCKNNKLRNRLSLSDAAEEELSNWVAAKTSTLPIQYDDATVTEVLLKRLVPMLKNPVNPSTSKFNLKCAIAEVLSDLLGPHCPPRGNDVQLYKLAEDLAIGLLAIQAQYEQDSRMAIAASRAPRVVSYTHDSQQTESIIHEQINKCLCATKFVLPDEIKIAIAHIIANYWDPKVYTSEVEVKKEMLKELHRYCIPEGCARHIVEDIMKEITIALNQSNRFQMMCIPTIINKISAFVSEDIFSAYPVASTPKKKEPLKQNPEEIEYEDKVTNLIWNWMETLPQFESDDDEDIFKETMIKDLAGEIVDQVKLEQIATIDEADQFRKHILYRWVNKMNVYDINEIKEQMDEFLRKLNHIEVPTMTKPQRDNLQAMAQLQENNENIQELHLPKATDILGDEVSIWMHEQKDLFDTDRDRRDEKIHEIVDVLREKLSNKRPEQEILKDLTEWLDGIVKPENKNNIGKFAADLKKRVIELPQNSTLLTNLAKREQERAEVFEETDKKSKCCVPVEFTTTDEDTIIVDKTMKQFISKYIEHNYDVDDPLARGAFSHLLKARLQRLNPPTRKEVDSKLEEASLSPILPRGKLIRELDYIKDVSDWLKNIAVAPSFNTTGNRNRIDFVNDLAHNILDIEEEREAKPDAMDYNLSLASMIGQFIDHVPIENEHHNSQYMNFIVKQLITKIMAHRNTNYNDLNNEKSVDISGVNDDNIGDFIEEFIINNGSDIADDELKLEAWSVRLLNEIKKMVHENTLTKGEVYNQLLDVPKPGDDTIKQFETEIEYIKEISQWIKNLPLLPISETEREERIKMINELTEKVTERDNMKLNNSNDTKADSEFAEYIAKWIGNLSLDESREVVVAVVIQQLLNRIEKVKSNFNESIQPPKPTIDPYNPIDNDSQPNDTDNSTENEPPKHNNLIKKDDTKIFHSTSPATAMVDAIEQWSKSLPITGNEKEVSSQKNDISKKLYQIIGELNIDPRTFYDDLLYKNRLEDEVDAVIEKLPQISKLQSNKKQLRDELVQNIIEAQQAIKENSIGEQYKHRLENEPPKHNNLIKKDDTKIFHSTSPATAMVDAIEQWSKSLPITGNEKEVSSQKNDISKKLYQIIGELNIDPRTFYDDLLYKNRLEDEVDAVIEKLPQISKLQSNKKQLRDELVQNIIEAQQAIKENSIGEQYKHRLEHAIEASMPHPVKSRQAFDPGFKIYKGHLADMFILDNFDHANDDVKVQYEKRIKKEIDKYYASVKNKNVVPITKDEIYNELYSALFKVPAPNENSVINEVEEIKTRCVIDMWYDKLPVTQTDNVTDLLERDNILAALAKRVHEIENSSLKSSQSRDQIRSEIKKWLGKLPLLPGQKNHIESFTKTLEKELKLSANQRKCMTDDPVKDKESKKGKMKRKSKDLSTIKTKPKKKAVDSLMAMVENWCLSLPIYSNRPQDAENDKILKDSLVTTIMIKLCELNMDPKTFNDDLLYDSLLDEELDNVLKDVPTSYNFEEIKAEKKQQLKDAIRSIKPLFREEKAKHQYNQNLDNTVAKILVTTKDLTPNKEADFKNIKEDIIENFIQLTYDKNNDQSRQAHKIKIHEAVVKFCSEYKNDSKDPLMLRNKLICELSKIPEPGQDTLKENVEEIRMKKDITTFLKEQDIDRNDDKTNQVKSSLAIKLNELELDGHTRINESKMKHEITKHLKNLNMEVNPKTIGKFIVQLKHDEGDRREPAKTNIDPCLSDCTPEQFCRRDKSYEDLQPTHLPDSDYPEETCLDHCRNRTDAKHKKIERAIVKCECHNSSAIDTTDCECLQGSSCLPTHENYIKRKNTDSIYSIKCHCKISECHCKISECHCKISDCAREIQKLAQGRQYMKFCPRNNDKISFCMPAGYFYF